MHDVTNAKIENTNITIKQYNDFILKCQEKPTLNCEKIGEILSNNSELKKRHEMKASNAATKTWIEGDKDDPFIKSQIGDITFNACLAMKRYNNSFATIVSKASESVEIINNAMKELDRDRNSFSEFTKALLSFKKETLTIRFYSSPESNGSYVPKNTNTEADSDYILFEPTKPMISKEQKAPQNIVKIAALTHELLHRFVAYTCQKDVDTLGVSCLNKPEDAKDAEMISKLFKRGNQYYEAFTHSKEKEPFVFEIWNEIIPNVMEHAYLINDPEAMLTAHEGCLMNIETIKKLQGTLSALQKSLGLVKTKKKEEKPIEIDKEQLAQLVQSKINDLNQFSFDELHKLVGYVKKINALGALYDDNLRQQKLKELPQNCYRIDNALFKLITKCQEDFEKVKKEIDGRKIEYDHNNLNKCFVELEKAVDILKKDPEIYDETQKKRKA